MVPAKLPLVVIVVGLCGCASPLSFIATVTPPVLDLTKADGDYPLTFDTALTNRSNEDIEFAAVLEYAIRVEYLRREGKLVAPSSEGPTLCSKLDSSVPCPCTPSRRALLPPGRSVKYSMQRLVFSYCERDGTKSSVEYRPRPGRYAIRFSYRAHGVTAVSNEVAFEISGR